LYKKQGPKEPTWLTALDIVVVILAD